MLLMEFIRVLVLSRCSIFRQQTVKMFHLSAGDSRFINPNYNLQALTVHSLLTVYLYHPKCSSVYHVHVIAFLVVGVF